MTEETRHVLHILELRRRDHDRARLAPRAGSHGRLDKLLGKSLADAGHAHKVAGGEIARDDRHKQVVIQRQQSRRSRALHDHGPTSADPTTHADVELILRSQD